MCPRKYELNVLHTVQCFLDNLSTNVYLCTINRYRIPLHHRSMYVAVLQGGRGSAVRWTLRNACHNHAKTTPHVRWVGNVSMYTLKVDQQLHAFAMKFPFTKTPNFAMSCIFPFKLDIKFVWHFITQEGINEYTCVCALGWGGDECEDRVGGCFDKPCLNGANCTTVSCIVTIYSILCMHLLI